ncbi:MAG: glycosyl transferase [Candidatus Portnoybacteria bacterium RIFCSPLOWO2_01_FULL_43_11]|uniref:Glycosyl transferase n=4 Tax=Bacteria candidate phyla TaxID=1783234 RepID=A0A1G2FSU9_9BACT|nr:MAG: glycosyl transferase [candidate division WWE3 bacterium RIFCSPHIGHO2_01_FULL_35_17]OGZ37714.1 MAG: glycosyl transferase [Candidatus Portnoybacteria bacterium RIFCSPHIGHO2_12_FULL_40_11]OGZ38434.1 MAG: glycosyl transferase [Candidatus Portnoybacteria bacterium RIFCSPLOWO2_01_FULL_43_11]OGZ40812.1 MAG: glycosyl transferase [Candidatus Portnoybacteria bacterium RIFCSPLOWO2_02_FULL_40_15]
MDKTSYLSLIIPFYNEEENLPFLVEKLNQVLPSLGKTFEVIFIDDGSDDNGFDILKSLLTNKNNWRIIRLRKNFGQTAAWAAGLDETKGEIIVIMDSDLENDPSDILLLLSKIDEGYDIVSGWRKNRWANNPLSRRLTSRLANWLIAKISGVKLHDFGCSLKAYRQEVLKDVKLYGEMHRFLAILASWQGAKIAEVVVNFTPRQFGHSKYGLERIIKVILDLIVIKFLSGYFTKPIYFFGRVGIFSIILSFLTFLLSVYYKFWGGKTFIETPLPVLTALFFIVGIILILIGLLAEMVMRVYHESRDRKIYVIKEKYN